MDRWMKESIIDLDFFWGKNGFSHQQLKLIMKIKDDLRFLVTKRFLWNLWVDYIRSFCYILAAKSVVPVLTLVHSKDLRTYNLCVRKKLSEQHFK